MGNPSPITLRRLPASRANPPKWRTGCSSGDGFGHSHWTSTSANLDAEKGMANRGRATQDGESPGPV